MLTATYIHASGVGPTTERSLWHQGATSWQAFAASRDGLRIPAAKAAALNRTVDESLAALAEGRIDYFARALPKREHWRAATHIGDKIGYLDIETDGGYDADSVTIIGLFDGFETHTYIKGQNLAQFAYECQDYDGFVTFFGTGFDVPFLKRRFPVLENVFADRFHIDLCPLLRKLGYRGGLKSIERQLKISRVPDAEGLDGMDAVRLWHAHQRGGRGADEALRLLLAYNKEDVVNMKTLLDIALPKMRIASGWCGPDGVELYHP